MAIRYQISTWSSGIAPKAFDFAERKRRDAALDQVWHQIYEMLASDGALDTKRAWRLRGEFLEFAKNVETGLSQGQFRSKTFYLREGENLSWQVNFIQERV